MSITAAPSTTVVAPAPKKHRSPAYPNLDLESALKLAKILWEKERRHPAAPAVVAKHWDYSEKSSGGMMAVSALKQFGLLTEDGGDGDRRAVKLDELALEILKNEEVPTERARLLKVAALKPAIYRALWTSMRDASNDSITRHLEFDLKFNSLAAAVVVSKYRETIKFAKLGDGDTIEETAGPAEEDEEETTSDDPIVKKKASSNTPPPPQDKPKIETPKTNVLATFKVPFALSEAEITFTGEKIEPADFDALTDYVAIFKKQYERKFKAQQSQEDEARLKQELMWDKRQDDARIDQS